MFARTPVQTAQQRPPQAALVDWATREAEARRNSEQLQRRAANGLRTTPLRTEGAAPANDPGLGAGQPLAPTQREFFESQFGQDFSRVRVHAGTQAAQLADEAAATAFTTGQHIIFGAGQFKPGTPAGAALMAHELTHVAQQGGAGSDATQCEPKPGRQGIGSAPPSEPVIIAKGVAPEDAFVLFEQNSADVVASKEKLAELFGVYAVPVTIELHGYASREGDTGYNSNLSGHRAAALKAKALELLPPGSQVVLYARGETQEFGAAKDNRRVGVKLVLNATPEPAKDASAEGKSKGTAKGRDAMSFDPIDPTLSKPTIPTGGGITIGGLPKPSTTTVTIPPFVPLPPLRPPSLLDWSELRAPFITRGLRLSDRDTKSVEQTWLGTYNFLRGLGVGPGLAAWGANKGTAYAYDNMLSLENPNSADKFERDFDKQLSLQNPGQRGLGTKILPLTGALKWASEKLFNKDLTTF